MGRQMSTKESLMYVLQKANNAFQFQQKDIIFLSVGRCVCTRNFLPVSKSWEPIAPLTLIASVKVAGGCLESMRIIEHPIIFEVIN